MIDLNCGQQVCQIHNGTRGNTVGLLSTLSRLFNGEKPQQNVLQVDDRTATRPMQVPRDSDATRPSYRIGDQEWLKIQKAIDQAG